MFKEKLTKQSGSLNTNFDEIKYKILQKRKKFIKMKKSKKNQQKELILFKIYKIVKFYKR